MNNVSLIGRLTRDIELKYTQGGTAMARFTLAVDRQFKNKETGEREVDFINCQAWGKTAEIMSNHLGKGRQVGVTGEIRTGSYEKSDGQKVYTTDVNVNNFTFVGNKSDGQAQQSPAQQYNQTAQQYAQTPNNFGGQPQIPNNFNNQNDASPIQVNGDDLPF